MNQVKTVLVKRIRSEIGKRTSFYWFRALCYGNEY